MIKARFTLDEESEGEGDCAVKFVLVSNMHPIRKDESYIGPVLDAVFGYWLEDEERESATGQPAGPKLYRLFDEMVTFTKKMTSDSWISQTFQW